jgi:hypothetical protein
MIFLSRGKSPSLLIVPGFEEIVQTTRGKIPVVNKPKWLKFTEFGAGANIHAPGLPTRADEDNLAGGYLDTEQVAKDIDHPEQEIIDFLQTHPKLGVEFVQTKEKEAETGLSIEIFEPEGDKGFYCKLCDQSLATAQAVNGHKGSKKHKIQEEEFYEAFRKRLKTNTKQ